MFPKDPIRNASQIISNLNRVFPAAKGNYLFGPMVQLAWGTPTLITAELGVVLEFGKRLRLLVLGQIAAILPKPENDLVRLQLDAIGVIDFDQGTVALGRDAVRFSAAEEVRADGRHGDALAVAVVAKLRSGSWRPASGVQSAACFSEAGTNRDQPVLG